jgi:phosphoribosylformylglycinamidine (FGAM) synthase PurS component
MTMEMDAVDESAAYAAAETACKKLLANLIMESYHIRVKAL